jgi:cysteinyl-tRNA synthetase
MKLLIQNTFLRAKEAFAPKTAGQVSLYVCGITPYSFSHIGHARVYIVFDVLVRILQVQGLQVTYIRNFTDIEDKILDRIPGDHTNIVPKINDFVMPFIADYHAGLKALNCLPPTHEPRVTETLPEIIDLTQRLLDSGHAYLLDGSIYYDIAAFSSYGKLSGHPLENLVAGARIENNDGKRNPGDFVLWKGNNQGLYWPSPWGYGRPGWHIECSAMIRKHVDHLDIHGGGADLMFPHHENERAQSEAGYGHELAKCWMHVEFLLMNKEKMSKSLGNVMLMKDVLADNNPMAFRFFILQHSYNKPLSFSMEDLQAAGRAFERLNDVLWSVSSITSEDMMRAILEEDVPFLSQAFYALQDDLNSAKALALIFENMSEIKGSSRMRSLVKTFLEQVLGLVFAEPQEQELSPEVQKLIGEREQARKDRNWARSDELRDALLKLGHVVQDKKL